MAKRTDLDCTGLQSSSRPNSMVARRREKAASSSPAQGFFLAQERHLTEGAGGVHDSPGVAGSRLYFTREATTLPAFAFRPQLFLDQRQGDLLGNVSEHRADDKGDHANNERVLERGRGDRAKLVACQGETGDSRVPQYACRNVAEHRRLGRVHKNENCDQDAYASPKRNAERAAERNLGDEEQRDEGHDRAEDEVSDGLAESGFLAATMIERRPGDERNPDLQPHSERRQENKRRDASEHADADRQCSDEIHSVLPHRYALTRFLGCAKLDTEPESSAVGADANLWLNYMQCP